MHFCKHEYLALTRAFKNPCKEKGYLSNHATFLSKKNSSATGLHGKKEMAYKMWINITYPFLKLKKTNIKGTVKTLLISPWKLARGTFVYS